MYALLLHRLFCKKKRKRTEDKRLDKAFELLTSAAAKPEEKNDEWYSFGIYIAKKMRLYSTCTRSGVQHAISNIIFNADRGSFDHSYFSERSFNPHPSPLQTYPNYSELYPQPPIKYTQQSTNYQHAGPHTPRSHSVPLPNPPVTTNITLSSLQATTHPLITIYTTASTFVPDSSPELNRPPSTSTSISSSVTNSVTASEDADLTYMLHL